MKVLVALVLGVFYSQLYLRRDAPQAQHKTKQQRPYHLGVSQLAITRALI